MLITLCEVLGGYGLMVSLSASVALLAFKQKVFASTHR